MNLNSEEVAKALSRKPVEWHVPGPWRYQEESDAYTHIVRAEKSFLVCQLQQDLSGEAEGNARFIATAPELQAENQTLQALCRMQHEALDYIWHLSKWPTGNDDGFRIHERATVVRDLMPTEGESDE